MIYFYYSRVLEMTINTYFPLFCSEKWRVAVEYLHHVAKTYEDSYKQKASQVFASMFIYSAASCKKYIPYRTLFHIEKKLALRND